VLVPNTLMELFMYVHAMYDCSRRSGYAEHGLSPYFSAKVSKCGQ